MTEKLSRSVANPKRGAMTVMEGVNVRSGADLGTQVWLNGSGPSADGSPSLAAERFRPVKVHDHGRVKPDEGGLWTAQWDEAHGGGWVQWCISEEYGMDRATPACDDVWLLEPDPDARVLVVDSIADLEAVCARWPHHFDYGTYRDTYPHWSLIAEEFDAFHLTDAGQWATRLTHPLSLYGWDCESTLWLRWAFAEITELGRRTFVAADPWWEDDTDA